MYVQAEGLRSAGVLGDAEVCEGYTHLGWKFTPIAGGEPSACRESGDSGACVWVGRGGGGFGALKILFFSKIKSKTK